MENTEKNLMLPTEEWAKAKYDELNQTLFDGELGDCSFGLFSSGKGSEGHTFGYFKMLGRVFVNRYSRRMYLQNNYVTVYVNRNNFVNLCEPRIEFNSHYRGTEDALTHTLLHEMCHYYTYMYGVAPKQGHGPEFREIASYVSSKSKGRFDIARFISHEAIRGYQLDDDMVQKRETRKANKKSSALAILAFKENKAELSIISTNNKSLYDTIINTNISRASEPNPARGKTTAIITSNDIDFIEYLFSHRYGKVLRTYRFWTLNNPTVLNDLLNLPHEVVWQSPQFNVNQYKMNENKKIAKIIEEEINSYFQSKKMPKDSIEITPDMNLSEYSPLELN